MFDAAVIGAGPAGSTTARLLAKAGWSVALIEKTAFPRKKVCGEFISASTLPLLPDETADQYVAVSGPEIKRVGMFAGETTLSSPMPPAAGSGERWGRATPRQDLDTLLARSAERAGAQLMQPCKLVGRLRRPDGSTLLLASGSQTHELTAGLVIAAMGSWERNAISNAAERAHAPTDLLAFKGHFRNSRLPQDLMPLLGFPGGYGGMVHTGRGQTSLSFCIQRDVLQRCREIYPGRTAADSGFQHILTACRGVRDALEGAELHGHWLAAGPIRPGLRACYSDGVFFAGNQAGEAHPIIAEGISMAIQAAWLLCRVLTKNGGVIKSDSTDSAGRVYSVAWRKAFRMRIRAAAAFANIALGPKTSAAAHDLISRFPALLSWGARLSGKAIQVVA